MATTKWTQVKTPKQPKRLTQEEKDELARKRAEAAFYDRLACGYPTDEQGRPY